MKTKTPFPAFRELGQVGERKEGCKEGRKWYGISKTSSYSYETIARKEKGEGWLGMLKDMKDGRKGGKKGMKGGTWFLNMSPWQKETPPKTKTNIKPILHHMPILIGNRAIKKL